VESAVSATVGGLQGKRTKPVPQVGGKKKISVQRRKSKTKNGGRKESTALEKGGKPWWKAPSTHCLRGGNVVKLGPSDERKESGQASPKAKNQGRPSRASPIRGGCCAHFASADAQAENVVETDVGPGFENRCEWRGLSRLNRKGGSTARPNREAKILRLRGSGTVALNLAPLSKTLT